MVLFMKPEDVDRLDGGRLTKVDAKWIFSSEQIHSHCGCGSSFSFDKKVIDSKKIKQLAKLFANVQQGSVSKR